MKKIISVFLFFAMAFGFSMQVPASDNVSISELTEKVGNYLYEIVKNPTVGSVGGEWAVLGLARNGQEITDEYFERYYQSVEKYVKDCDGILHKKKITEYSRVIVALTAIGKNPGNVAGYNLLMPLGDYEKTVWQGINGAIWALIALDCGNYTVPVNSEAKTQATRELYISHILERQISDGGWALYGDTADPDVTGMAIQALSGYQDVKGVKEAIDKALECMSKKQNATGGFSSGGVENSECCAQMLSALCTLGISVHDERFVKDGKTLLDNLLSFYVDGKGFKHTYDGETNQMATEQCFYALVALKRANESKSPLYRMNDVPLPDGIKQTGLYNKNHDVNVVPIIYYGKTFDDIKNDINKNEIEALAARGIINGKNERMFEPQSTMTRAEFATIVTRGLGLPIVGKSIFDDVCVNDWFYSYVSTAFNYGIINGVSETEFNPNGTITREEAATMIARAAKLCGHDTVFTVNEVRNVLAGFSDYMNASEWAREPLAFCFLNGILDNNALKINPKESIARTEIAYMLYGVLKISELLQELL